MRKGGFNIVAMQSAETDQTGGLVLVVDVGRYHERPPPVALHDLGHLA